MRGEWGRLISDFLIHLSYNTFPLLSRQQVFENKVFNFHLDAKADDGG